MRKIFTFFTLIFFTANTLVWGAPADAMSLLAGNSHAQDGLTIVHIQDAHSNYEAQKNIQEILKNLHEKEGYSFVALEGAWQPLAPEVYHFFSDAKSNLKVADFLAQKGEMSGAELYALDLSLRAKRSNLAFEGVEDPKVFREDYELFKKGLAAQDESKKYCDDLFAKLDLEKSRVYSPEFLRFDRNVRDYENKRLELAAFLRVLEKSAKEKLQVELTSPNHQREWPYLCRMLRVMNVLQGLDMEAVKKDATKLEINLEDKTLAANPRAFFESVYADSIKKHISLDGYKALCQYSEYVILKSEITGPELFAEMDSLIEKLSDVYAVSPKEKELLTHSRQTRLLEKLLKYEATGEEWEKIKRMPVDTKASAAFHFYQLAESRNQILLENTLAKMKSRGVKKAILITGGFHSDGIESLAKQKNISYRTIQPQIHEEFSNQRYRDAVLGTWRKEIAQSKIPKPLAMVKQPYDSGEYAEIINIALVRTKISIVRNKIHPRKVEYVKAASLGDETSSQKIQLAKRLHADLFNKTISIEKRRKIASELIGLDPTISFQDSANARGRMLDAIVSSSTPEEASERLRQLSAVLYADAEAQIRKTEALGYKRDPAAVLLGQAGYQTHHVAVMIGNPIQYFHELENPSFVKPAQYFAIAGVIAVTLLAFVNVFQELFKAIVAGVLIGTMMLFLGAVIYSMARAIWPEKISNPFDWENVFGPDDVAIFNEFRQEFWHGDYDFSKINLIQNVSLRLGLISEIANAQERGTFIDGDEAIKFKEFLVGLKKSDQPRIASFAEKLLEDKFQDGKDKIEKPRLAEGASLGQFDALGQFEKELKKKWENFFYQTARIGMNLSGEDHERFLALRKARLAFLYYLLIDGRSYDKFFWDWRRLPVYFAELPVKYHTVRTVEWLNLAFPNFAPREVHSEEAAQESTDFLQQAVHEIENNYAEFLKFQFKSRDSLDLIPQTVSNTLSETYLRVLEERGEEDTLEYIYYLRGFLRSNHVAEKSDGVIRVIKIPILQQVRPEKITLYEVGQIDLPWDPILYETSIFTTVWNGIKKLISIFRQLIFSFSSSHRAVQRHHELFLEYLELIKNREAMGMPQLYFGIAWDKEPVDSLELEKMIDGFKQNPDFVVKAINQAMNTREISHRIYPETPEVLKQKLSSGNTNIEISKADPSKIKLYRRQISELKETIREEKSRQKQWQAANAKSLGGSADLRAKMLSDDEVLELKSRVEGAVKDVHQGIFAVGPFVLINVIKPGFIVNATTMLEVYLQDLILGFEARLKDKLGKIYEQNKRNILFVNPSLYIHATSRELPLSLYTISMLEQMVVHAGLFLGAQVIDFGAGDGLLSRFALALGARKVVLAEREKMPLNLARIFLEKDGWLESTRNRSGYVIREGDIKTKILGNGRESEPIRRNTKIVLANIGPWDEFYGEINRLVMERASTWPSVSLILNGGYLYFGKFPFASLPDEGKKHHKAIEEMKPLLKSRGFEAAMTGFLTAGTLVATKAVECKKVNGASLGRKGREFLGPENKDDSRLSGIFRVHGINGMTNSEAGGIFNIIGILESEYEGKMGFLHETIKNLDLKLGKGKFTELQVSKLSDQNKTIYKIRLIAEGGKDAEFVLYRIEKDKMLHHGMNGYERAQEIRESNPGLKKVLPKLGAVRKIGDVQWITAQYLEPAVVFPDPTSMIRVYFELFEAGWTINDLYPDQVMHTRSNKQVNAKLIDLDYLRQLRGENASEENQKDLEEQISRLFAEVCLSYGIKSVSLVAKIGINYIDEKIIFSAYKKFVKGVENNSWAVVENQIRKELGMPQVKGASLGSESLHRIQPLSEIEAHQLAEDILRKFQGTKLAVHSPIVIGGKQFGFESDQEFDSFDPWLKTSRVIRIGPLIFVMMPRRFDIEAVKIRASMLKKTLGRIYSEHPGNIFFIQPSSDGTESPEMPLSAYTRSFIAAMLVHPEKFKDAVTVDFGAGNGILSRIALRLGAQKAVLIERSPEFILEAIGNLEAEGWKSGTNYIISRADIEQPEFAAFAKAHQLDEKATVLLANLGPWEHYGNVNQKVIELAERWKNIELFINGGYGFPDGWLGKAGLWAKGLWHNDQEPAFETAKNNLEQHSGFQVETYRARIDFPARRYQTGTLIAVRAPKAAAVQSAIAEGSSLGVANPRKDADVLSDLKKIFHQARPLAELGELVDSIQLEDLKYPKDGLIISGNQLNSGIFSDQNLYGISIPVDKGGFSGDILEGYVKDGALHLIVADAIGHDLPASFNRYLFQALTKRYPLEEVHQIFRDWHQRVRHLMRTWPEQKDWPFLFFGLRYLELKMDLSTGKTSIRNATKISDNLVEGPKGQMNNLSILVSDASEQMIAMEHLAGGKPEHPWQELILKEGFLILLQTDGAYEARNRQKPSEERDLGLEKIKSVINEVLSKNPEASAKEIIELIMTEVKSHLGDEPISDDITLLAFRVPNVTGASLGVEDQLKKFESELNGNKITETRLKEMVDWAENAKKFGDLRKVFIKRLIANENDSAAKRGIAFLNAREFGFHEFAGLMAPVSTMDGGQSSVRALAVSLDAKLFASGTESGVVKVWDVETGRQLYRFEEKGFAIKSLEFGAGGRNIRADGVDFSSRVWIFNTGQKITHPATFLTAQKFLNFDKRPLSMKSSDSKRTIELDTLGNIKVCDSQSKVLYEINGQDILSLDISSDDRFFVTGGYDGRVLIWNFEGNHPRNRELAFLGGNHASVYSVKFSPDGNWVISGSRDNFVRLWAGHERSLKGFWQRFQLGFRLSDAEVKAVQDRIDFLGRHENYKQKDELEAYAKNWQSDLADMVAVQARKLASKPYRDPKWKTERVWLQDALAEFLQSGSGFIPQKQWDKLMLIEDEMRQQLGIQHQSAQANTFWHDAQNILLVLELLRRSDPIVKLPNPEFPQTSGLSLGAITIETAKEFAGDILPFWLYTSPMYPQKPKAVVASGGFSVTVKTNDNFNLEAEQKYLREHPRSVSVVLDQTGLVHEEDRLVVLPVKAGQEAEAVQSLLSGKNFTKIAKLARKLYEKPGVRLTQSAIHKRITIEAPTALLAQIGMTASAQLLEIPSAEELSDLKIIPNEFSAYALVHAALLGRAEGDLNDPLLKPFRANIERNPVTGIYRIVRNSLADRIAALETSLDVSRKILAAA